MTHDLILLPPPQELTELPDKLELPIEGTIRLPGPSLLSLGRWVQSALAMNGREWVLTASPDPAICTVAIDPARVPRQEGYQLEISPTRLMLVGHDEAGVFYGAMTLRQIARQWKHTGSFPCLRIRDWPDFAHRGVMLDISRDKVPTMNTLYRLLDLLAEWKINQFQLYTEHTFSYSAHRRVWEHASPLTGEEMMVLDRFCREHFIELVPNQNSFGHMERWLCHPEYKYLAEAPAGFTDPWGNWREQPSTLCPLEPGSLKLVTDLYQELLPHFFSRQFNVGCDETFELGQGRSREFCHKRGVGRVYLDFLLQIHQQVSRHGRTMQFWGDVILKHPELISELPPDLIALEWGYQANHPFETECQQFAEAGIPFYVCPGTSTWNSIAGRTDNMLQNVQNAATHGLKHGAIGLLNTDWGDNGHWQPLAVSFPGFAYGAAMSWAPKAAQNLDLITALSYHAFHDKGLILGQCLYDLGNTYRQTGLEVFNASVLSHWLLHPENALDDKVQGALSIERLVATTDWIKNMTVSESRMACVDAAIITDELELASALLLHACQLGIARLSVGVGAAISDIPSKIRRELLNDIQSIQQKYKKVWFLRYRHGGMSDSMAHLLQLAALYKN